MTASLFLGKVTKKNGVREARTLDLRITRSYETYALANCATTPFDNSN